jgi:hypothetical protein
MAIPFFILAGNFLTHGGVARRMIASLRRWSATGTAGWRWPVMACPVCRGVGLLAGDGGGHRLDHSSGDGRARFRSSAREYHDFGPWGSSFRRRS